MAPSASADGYCLQPPVDTGAQCHQPADDAKPGSNGGEPTYTSAELEAPGPATYEKLLLRLEDAAVSYQTMGPHEACRTSEDSVRVRRAGGWEDVTLETGAKAMLLRTAKGDWLLAVLPANCKLSWKKIRAVHGKGTRMASEEEVAEVTGCLPGAVPPIAAFPQEVGVVADLTLPSIINFNCGLRTRSIQMTRQSYELVQQPTFADIIG
eukprot:Skav218559  [mRNA]  locus=scaffold1408:26725:27351:- [translate_table: standard]